MGGEIPRRRFVQVGGTALVVGLAGCTGDGGGGGDNADVTTTTENGTTDGTETTETTTGEGDAYLRAAHVSPDAPAVDVYVDGEVAFSDAEFPGVTEYAEVSAGTREVRITAAGDESTVVFDQEVDVSEGFHTAVAYGELEGAATTTTTGMGNETTTADGMGNETTTGNETTDGVGNGTTMDGTATTTNGGRGGTGFSVTLLDDESEAPDDDEAVVRLFHASPDAPAVDVTVEESEDALFDGASFGEVTDYESVPAGDYTLEVRPDAEDGDGDPVATFDVALDPGTAVTAFAVGYVEDEPELDLLTAVDGRTGDGDGTTTDGTTTTENGTGDETTTADETGNGTTTTTDETGDGTTTTAS